MDLVYPPHGRFVMTLKNLHRQEELEPTNISIVIVLCALGMGLGACIILLCPGSSSSSARTR